MTQRCICSGFISVIPCTKGPIGGIIPSITFVDLNYASGEHNGETGVKLAQHVREKYPKLRVIGIHDGHDNKIEDKAQELGLNSIITRPIKNRQLLKVLET